ncbi:MAG: L-2-hydroxyglutarate oxidase [Gaiellaceae bacterium]
MRVGPATPSAGRPDDVVVVGGGILGLAVARELITRHPRIRLSVLEKEDELASHQTGHNSGVIHSGIYYAPGSLKARLCVEGNELLYEYCDRKEIPYERCGKLIVATEESEVPRLEELYRRGRENGVSGLRKVDRAGLSDVEPYVRGVQGLHAPDTGIVDFKRVAFELARDIEALGGTIRTGTEVTDVRPAHGQSRVVTTVGDFPARAVVTCAGLYSDRVAQMTGAPASPRIVPFRGSYYALREESRRLVKGLIYPVPDPAFPFLGVHFTKQISGDVWAGPNAVLAFRREGYRARDVRLDELWLTLSYRGFWRLARKYWRTGAAEIWGEMSKRSFVRALQRLVPEITRADVIAGPAGVRAQAMDEQGRLLDDFWLDEDDRTVHVRNAPSPGATSSLALARMISSNVARRFGLE